MQHADDGYSRRGNFGGSLVHIMYLMYSTDDTNVDGLRDVEFEGIGGRRRGLKVVKSCSYGTFFIHFWCRMCRLAAIHFVTDRQTDGWTDRQTDRRQYSLSLIHI